MTAKTILALVQAHRKEPTRQSYAAMANAVRKLEADRATAERNENTALNAMEKLEADLVRFKEFSKLAGRALNEAWAVVGTVEGESYSEAERLALLLDSLRELTHQAYSLNGVMTAGQLERAIGRAVTASQGDAK